MRLLLGVLLFVLAVAYSRAETLYVAVAGTSIVSLTDEPCAVKTVSNLPLRATWVEAGKHYEGCYGIAGSMVILYFDDLSVAGIPAQAFKKARDL